MKINYRGNLTLMPCRFCGSEAILDVDEESHGDNYYITAKCSGGCPEGAKITQKREFCCFVEAHLDQMVRLWNSKNKRY